MFQTIIFLMRLIKQFFQFLDFLFIVFDVLETILIFHLTHGLKFLFLLMQFTSFPVRILVVNNTYEKENGNNWYDDDALDDCFFMKPMIFFFSALIIIHRFQFPYSFRCWCRSYTVRANSITINISNHLWIIVQPGLQFIYFPVGMWLCI